MSRWTSTQEDGWTLIATAALAQKTAEGSISVDGEELGGTVYRRYFQEEFDNGPLVIANNGNKATEAKISVTGIPKEPPAASENGFKIDRVFYNLDGTEADLGDGLPDLVALRTAGARLCTGVDSHVITDPIAELRALETLARLRDGTRLSFTPSERTPAEQLWREGSIEGAVACGFSDVSGTIRIPRDHATLALVPPELLFDAVVFSGSGSITAPVIGPAAAPFPATSHPHS